MANNMLIRLTQSGNDYMQYYSCSHCLLETIDTVNKCIAKENFIPRDPFIIAVWPSESGDEINVCLLDNVENVNVVLDFTEFGKYNVGKIQIRSKRTVGSLTIKHASLSSTYSLENQNVPVTYVDCF